ncbi:recombinase family protein [Gleimia europaea]|nr:recombinase family protein [Gleimia europaea]MDK8534186.1 recombinase family protein [Gleimia europaea]
MWGRSTGLAGHSDHAAPYAHRGQQRNARRRAAGQEEKSVPDAQPWAYTSLHSILRNPVYAGYSTYKKAKRKGVKNKYRRVTHIVRDPDTGEPVKGQ